MENEDKDSAATPSDGGDAGTGASGEGGNKWTPPADGSWVPRIRLEEAVENERAKVARLEAELVKANAAKSEKTEKNYTRSELNALVVEGKLTQEQSDELFARQIRAEAKAEAAKIAQETVAHSTRTAKVATDMAQYKKLAPEIMQDGSDTRTRIAEEYRYLIAMGNKDSLETELIAIRAVLGPLDRLEKARAGKTAADPHVEVGGEGQGRNRQGSNKAVDRLSQRQRDYYDDMIKKGHYKNWGEVEKELAYARKAA